MKRTIYKYYINNVRRQEVDLPQGFEILHVGQQDGNLVLWAMVDADAPTHKVPIMIFGTGHPVPEDSYLYHIGTVQVGAFVWHIFEDVTEEYNYIESK